MNGSNQNLLSRVNGASVASCESNNYSIDKETNSSEIKSANKVACPLIRFLFSKFLSVNSLPCAFRFQTIFMVVRMKRIGEHDFPCPLNNMIQQPNNCARETRK